MDSVYFAFGGIGVLLIIQWAMTADRRGDPYTGLLAMRRPRPDDQSRRANGKSRRRRPGADRK